MTRFFSDKESHGNQTSCYNRGRCRVFRSYTAAVMTQLTDVEGELNGFITYDRRQLKVTAHKLAALNQKLH
jgi:hypothetical protein